MVIKIFHTSSVRDSIYHCLFQICKKITKLWGMQCDYSITSLAHLEITQINYTMQDITYLKIGSIFHHNIIKSFKHILKKKKDNYIGISSNLLPMPFVSPNWTCSLDTNRANRRGLAAPADTHHTSPQTKKIPTGKKYCSSIQTSSLKKWDRNCCSNCSHSYPDSAVPS